MGKDGSGGISGGPTEETRRSRSMSDERIESAAKELLDETERMFYKELEDDRFLPALFRTINNMRFELNMKKLVLTVEEKHV